MGLVEQAQGWFEDADVIERVENTYQPDLDGTRWKVTKVGKTFFDSEAVQEVERPGRGGTISIGEEWRGVIPQRASDVLYMDAFSVTFRLHPANGDKGHSVTYRKEVR